MFTDNVLRELLNYSSPDPVLSVYINTDMTEGTADALKLRLRTLLKEVDLPKDEAAIHKYFETEREWTGRSLAMFSCALFFILAPTLYPKILKMRNFWLYILISFIPFIIFNYLLTSLILVHYNPDAIWGVRITTIPLEDFFYNFSMLSFYLMVYLYFRKRWNVSEKF